MPTKKVKKKDQNPKLGSGLAETAKQVMINRRNKNKCARKGMGYDQTTGKCTNSL